MARLGQQGARSGYNFLLLASHLRAQCAHCIHPRAIPRLNRKPTAAAHPHAQREKNAGITSHTRLTIERASG